MKLTIDSIAGVLTRETTDGTTILPLYSRLAFETISDLWLKVGWQEKYIYTFSWFGRPIIQLPEDMIRMQEILYHVKPDVIIETGVAHGGSLVFYASLCRAMNKGRVIGVDIEIRPNNRKAIEDHELASLITLVEGSSVSQSVVQEVHNLVQPGETAVVVLDSNHSQAHVLNELEAYHDLVSSGSYIVATDGIQGRVSDVPRGKPDWAWDHPSSAALEFARTHPDFVLEQPAWPFNESELANNVTHWPDAWLRRL